MKTEITYTARHNCYLAEATINGTWINEASSVSYQDAREKLLNTIRKLTAAPPPEIIETT